MIEIIALIFLTRKIGDLAETKGLKKGWWKLITVLAWFGTEILIAIVVIALLGEEMLIPGALLGILAGYGSYLLIKNYLEKMPDAEKELEELASHLN